MLHSLLKRQLKKAGLCQDNAPSSEAWGDFLQRINRAYNEADQERYLLERSLTISSHEMQGVYEQLRKSETRYAVAAAGANDGLWDWDLLTNEIYFSPRWQTIMGCSADDEPSSPITWLECIHPDDRGTVEAELAAHIEGNTQHFQNEHRIIQPDGSFRWVLSRGLAVRDDEGVAVRLAGSLTDISERKQAEHKLHHDARHDMLTGLPNRTQLMDRLTRALERSKHNHDYSFAILFLDLDRFKVINDSLGHLMGDQLLISVAKRLALQVRPSDMVARLGGDEFVILLDNLENQKHVISIATRIIQEFSQPFHLKQDQAYASTSIGIAYGNATYERAENLLRDADIAMYRAKARGKSRFEIFNPEMHNRALSLLQLENDLRHAIQNNELILHYQPIVILGSGQTIGFEALVRWQHPRRGMIPPMEFIPVAEDTDIIYSIGEWVLREACRQMVEWDQLRSDASTLMISVNLSPKQLEQAGFVESVQSVLTETGLAPHRLKLEITETVLMKNTDHSILMINQLRAMGISISIDDFGTGYSSLSYLHRFPIDTLKIDRSFINGLSEGGENSKIVQTIISLAHSLGIDVVAEGVETNEQLTRLHQMNCSYGQGYFYSKPIKAEQIVQLIQELPTGETNSQSSSAATANGKT